MSHEYHTPVLAGEVLHYLCASPDGIYVDGTLGGGGHAEGILMNTSPRGKLIGFDLDSDAIMHSSTRLERFGDRVTILRENYVNLRGRLHEMGIERINGILLDLGVSSHQIDGGERGFSFQRDGRLDMRMNIDQPLSGWDVVNAYGESQLSDILWRFGEERNSRRIARAVSNARLRGPIDSTGSLARVVESAVGRRMLTKTLARVFQAIRIEVNNELANLQRVLFDASDLLQEGGRIVVISYHSLEDRLVKHFFRAESARVTVPGSKLLPAQPKKARLAVLTLKPVLASGAELSENPRARSAKLRAAERI